MARAIATWLFAWLACGTIFDVTMAPRYRDGTPVYAFLVFFLTPVAVFVSVNRLLAIKRGLWKPQQIRDYVIVAGESVGTVATMACYLHAAIQVASR